MVLIGLLLIAAAVAAAIILVVQNDHSITVHVFNSDYNVAAYWLAIAGLAIMAVLALGLWAMRAGAAHRLRRRRERRELVRENRRLSEREASLRSRIPDTSAGTAHTTPTGGTSVRTDGAHAADPGRVPPNQT
jgi:cell division protein FtsB